MTREQIRDAVLRSIRKVAPEAKADRISGDADIRDELDIDSMDFLNLVVALHAALGVDVAERDYPRLFTLDGAVRYFEERLGQAAPVGT